MVELLGYAFSMLKKNCIYKQKQFTEGVCGFVLKHNVSFLLCRVALLAVLVNGGVLRAPVATAAEAVEKLGELEVSDLLLEPQFFYTEPKTGRFEIGNSLFSVRWLKDQYISGQITVGTKSLLGVPKRYSSETSEEIGLVEGFAQAETYWGRVRFGLIPLHFGYEGALAEGSLKFPRSLWYRERLLGLRDFGLSYAVDNEGFFSEWTIHNGESGKDLDNKAWFTARAGYEQEDFFVGLTGATGRTTQESTNPSGNRANLADGFVVSDPARVRMAGVFIGTHGPEISVAAEALVAENFQQVDFKSTGGHLDLIYDFAKHWTALARYDRYDPNGSEANDRLQEWTMGLSYKSNYETSAVYLYVTRLLREGADTSAHQFRIVWRLTPYIHHVR